MTNEEMQKEIERLHIKVNVLAKLLFKVAAETMVSDAAFDAIQDEWQSVDYSNFDSRQLRDGTLAGGSGFQSGGM